MSVAVTPPDLAGVCHTGPVGLPLPLDELTEPGTYICNWSGHLLRVHESDPARFAAVRRTGGRQWTVTRISNTPDISRVQAKALANRLGLNTAF